MCHEETGAQVDNTQSACHYVGCTSLTSNECVFFAVYTVDSMFHVVMNFMLFCLPVNGYIISQLGCVTSSYYVIACGFS